MTKKRKYDRTRVVPPAAATPADAALDAMSESFEASARELDEQALTLPRRDPALDGGGGEHIWRDPETGEHDMRWRPNLAETSIKAGFGECWKLLIGACEALGDDPCGDARRDAAETARLLEDAAAKTDDEEEKKLIMLTADDQRDSVLPRAPQRDPLELLRELWARLEDLEDEVLARFRIVSGREALGRLRPNTGGLNKRNSPLRALLTIVLRRGNGVRTVADLWSLLRTRVRWDTFPDLPEPWLAPATVEVQLSRITISVKGCPLYEHESRAVEKIARETGLLVEDEDKDKVKWKKNR